MLMFCEVYLLDTPYHIDRPFDYSCDAGVVRGSIVRVPFGRSGSTRLGVVTALKDSCDVPDGVTLKSVVRTVSPLFTLTDEYVAMRMKAQKMIENHETDKPLAALIDPEYKDQKAVKIAIAKIERGEFKLVRGNE